jgi:hypothetical protein
MPHDGEAVAGNKQHFRELVPWPREFVQRRTKQCLDVIEGTMEAVESPGWRKPADMKSALKLVST